MCAVSCRARRSQRCAHARRRWDFPAAAADTKVSSLSGGEKARLLLGLAAFHGPHLLILDEPTNHLDIEAREALIEAVNEYDGRGPPRHPRPPFARRLRRTAVAGRERHREAIRGRPRPVSSRRAGSRRRATHGRSRGPCRRKAARSGRSAPSSGRCASGSRRSKREIEKLEKEIAEIDIKLADSDLALGQCGKDRATRPRSSAEVRPARQAEEEWLAASARREELSA